jgi:surface protein
MLEAVVVVGVLLALAVGGFFAYGPITKNAKIAKVKSAVSEVYTAVTVAQIDGDPTTSAAAVIDAYNASQSTIKFEIRRGETQPTIAAMSTEGYTPQSDSDFCLKATAIGDVNIFAEMGDCKPPVTSPTPTPTATANPTQAPTATATPTPTPTPTIYVDPTPTKTILKYRCDVTTEGNIPLNTGLIGIETWSDGVMRDYSGGYSYGVKRTLNAGTDYTVVFDGTYRKIMASSSTWNQCLRSVDHWGSATGVLEANAAFSGATNLTDVPEHIPTSITTANLMFKGAVNLNDPDVSKWSVSNVTDMNSMFMGASKFNQPLNGWNVSNVTKMNSMFENASSFNQPLNSWNTSKVTEMQYMFRNASSFNQSLASWNTSNVTDMHMMFYGAPYSQDLSTWNLDKVSRMAMMFNNPDAFNGNIQRTTHSKMTKITFKCDVTTSGNFPIDTGLIGTETWSDGANTFLPGHSFTPTRTLQAGVTYTGTFEGVYYNLKTSSSRFDKCIRSLDHWGEATTARSGYNAFSGAVNLTNVPDSIPSTVTNTSYMFKGATNFNDSDVSNWNVSKVTDMGYMFNGASKFNQNLSNWNVSKVTARTGFDTGSALTAGNLPKFV